MPDPVRNLRDTFAILQRDVRTSVRIHAGNAQVLNDLRGRLSTFLENLNRHASSFVTTEFASVRHNISFMFEKIDAAHHASRDVPDGPPLQVHWKIYTGRRGRPRTAISAPWLAQISAERKKPGITPLVGCSISTLRRRELEYGLSAPGRPFVTRVALSSGGEATLYNSDRSRIPPISDEEVDAAVAAQLEIFPNFGRSMITGGLRVAGHHISRNRIREAYNRLQGGPSTSFANRRIHRRAYCVAGPNSLWHHDGQHGLIRYKIVIHAFVDGFSRFVVGIQVVNNNRGETVLQLFHKARAKHGTPSRVRGDHGVENIQVAAAMEDIRGENRGSYIWGRSIHNTRIERLWYDVTSGFGHKWKCFFLALEQNDGLDPSTPAHIWLLQFLFLPSIDEDAQQWAASWNAHKMQIRGERTRSPTDMFMVGMLQHGPRGTHLRPEPDLDENIGDAVDYGVDWNVHRDRRLMNHLYTSNPEETHAATNFRTPTHIARVLCDPPNCPFTPAEMESLRSLLMNRARDLLHRRDMASRRLLWNHAFNIAAILRSS